MILPRIGMYEHSGQRLGIRMRHMVAVDGDEIKLICSRQIMKTGKLKDPDGESLSCTSCMRRGWGKGTFTTRGVAE